MHFSQILFALALAASASAHPVDHSSSHLLERDGTYTCKPKENDSSVKTFTVSESRAKNQAAAGAFEAGKSGDPHKYGNGDGIKWDVKGCDRTGKDKHQLWEYPIYWDAKGKEWDKDKLSKNQDGKTPLRVVYFKDPGNSNRPKVCGVMTHSEVDKDFQGKKFFQKCSK
ncbi:hypothetical protein PG996_007588 [Apiospora saccharicola]|uniref:Uncharacterized protein n=1 Tax=Apiospora saccharicola TaxID=335842 RepID=A0ABR1VB94_9PEZI